MRVLVVNAGSSSVKLSVLDGDGAVEAQESVEPAAAGEALGRLLGERPDAVGHRVVHGGARFTGPTLVDDDVLAGIDELRVLAPLHQGPAVDALSQAREALPGVPQVACFDTAFHHTIPPAAATYAIPRQWRQELGVHRYGFHGLAHEVVGARGGDRRASGRGAADGHRAPRLGRVAVRGRPGSVGGHHDGLHAHGRAGDGHPQRGPRPGGADLPGAQGRRPGRGRRCAGPAQRPLALAGASDVRDVVAAADGGDGDAALALDVWTHRARGLVAAMAAAMGGLDVLAFSGGVGERSSRLRARIVDGLGFLGLALDPSRNEAVDGDADIGTGVARTVVVAAREDAVIARQVRALLG